MHVRCPHCHNPIELVDDSSFENIDCPSCGSRFSLAADAPTASFRSEGKKTIGHFHLIESIGVGHFGTVWKARDTELDRTVAIKGPPQGPARRSRDRAILPRGPGGGTAAASQHRHRA